MADVKAVRLRNVSSGAVVSVAEEKATRLGSQWVPVDKATNKAESDTDQPQGYAAMKAADLKAAIEKRNVNREDDAQLSTSGNKAALVAVLEADDEASNSADDEDSDESGESGD